jgi:hypothetical protein
MEPTVTASDINYTRKAVQFCKGIEKYFDGELSTVATAAATALTALGMELKKAREAKKGDNGAAEA